MRSIKWRIISTVLIGLILLSGCNGNTGVGTTSSNRKLTIVTSFYPIYIHTINITKNIPGVSVINMTKPQTGCLHDYSLTPSDLKTLQSAQVFVINGAGMESFMDKVIGQLPKLKVMEASRGIELIKEDGDDEGNPHVWVSISNAIQQVRNIGEQLASEDQYNAEQYKSNMETYIRKLEEKRTEMHNVLDGVKSRDIVTFHEAFPYFAKEFELNIAAVVEREPGTEPSARELAETIQTVKKLGIKALFAEPQYPAKAADTIAGETGAHVYTLDPGVTGEANGDTDAYLKIMDNNLKVLKEALK